MNPIFKPYRLINQVELTALQTKIETMLQQWNEVHALFPLTSRLSLGPTKTPNLDLSWDTEQRSSLSLIKHSLFGDESNCFNDSAKTLFSELLTGLFGSQLPEPIEDWFYNGTPSLTLTLSCIDKTMTLYLNPQWVLKELPSSNNSQKPLSTLPQALATKPIHLDVKLNPLVLKLTEMIRLNVGDVIKTDHLMTQPAYLSHKEHRICDVDIGQSNSFKTIQITRES